VILKSVICLKSSWIPKADIKVVNTHLTFSRRVYVQKIGIGVMFVFHGRFSAHYHPELQLYFNPNRSWKHSTTSDRQYAHEQYFVSVIVTNLGPWRMRMGMVKKDINNDGSFSQNYQ